MRDLTFDAAAAVFSWPWAARALQGLARIGYMARGLVYLLVGWLAAASAFSKARPPSVWGALSAVSDLSAGWIVLAFISLGLLAYALWRLAEAVLDISDRGWGGKGLLLRACMLGDALLQAALGFLAGTVALGWTGLISKERTIAEIGAERALDWPLGHWILGVPAWAPSRSGAASWRRRGVPRSRASARPNGTWPRSASSAGSASVPEG